MSGLRDWLATALGVDQAQRTAIVSSMLERFSRERVSYWFQLMVAMGIATFGLVLGSTGVVIGAMLVSPLMGPIVEFGMGLAIGSPMLVVRGFGRTLASVVAVVLGAALIAVLLPYHDVTTEIAARTSPTVLDLFVAGFCALAAAYTTVRSSADSSVTAAGTAIGISLVPPLCVGGYGIGTGMTSLSRGALLLFTANFSAIVLLAVACFVLLRFDRVDVFALEEKALAGGGRASRTTQMLHAVFGGRYGRLLRLAMPVVVAGAVFVPLRRALIDVSWEVQVRQKLAVLLQELPAAKGAIRSTITVGHHTVALRLVIVGTPAGAKTLEATLKSRITEIAGVAPFVDVVAVADSQAVKEAAAPLVAQINQSPAPAPVLPIRPKDLEDAVAGCLEDGWPAAAGTVIDWRLHLPKRGPTVVEVTHLGLPLGSRTEQLLASALSGRLGTTTLVHDVALSSERTVAEEGREVAWLTSLVRAVDAATRHDMLRVCIEQPAPPEPKKGKPAAASPIEGEVRALVAAFPQGRARVDVRDAWAFQLTTGTCAAEASAMDGGTSGAIDGGADAP